MSGGISDNQAISQEYFDYIKNGDFPCVAAKTSLIRNQAQTFVARHMACPADDQKILEFLYNFIDIYRASGEMFFSAAIIFANQNLQNEDEFESLMWKRLQALSDLDAKNYPYDKRVSNDVNSDKFSFSLKEEAFFIIGLNPLNSRKARRFKYPTLVFNAHQQFEILREKNCFEKMKKVIRARDEKANGTVNSMLHDYGDTSEVAQYSGKEYGRDWQCPLKIHHQSI